MMDLEVGRRDIDDAARRIAPYTRRTPLLDLGNALGAGYRISLKLDNHQPTGSFKVRGAFSLLTARTIPSVGVTAASGGNFGIAVAHACQRLGHRATIFVPESSPAAKLHKIEAFGAELRVVPGYYADALAACSIFTEGSGAFQAHAYDQPEVVAGQGTMGREITGQASDVDTVLAAVGGGGLIGGIASWCRDDVGVISVEPELCPSMHAAFRAGGPTEVDVGGVAASSLGARSIGEHAWYAARWVDEAVLVSEEAILTAQRWLWETARVAAEPASATTIAGLLSGVVRPRFGEHVVAVISGANFDPVTML